MKMMNQKTKKLKIIIIISIIAIIVIAFIFILIFVILKKDDKIPIIIDVDEGGDDMVTYTVANNSKKYEILGITTVYPEHYLMILQIYG